jgi:DNA polymerase-3 subunit epsilon
MRDRVYEYLTLRPDGATSREILDLLFTHPGTDPEFGPRFVDAFLSGDPRFLWDAQSERWRLRRFELFDRPIREAAFTVVDLETTGLSPDPGGIIEIGAARLEDGKVVARFEQLVRPRTPVPPFIVRLTGIRPELLESQPHLEEVWEQFVAFVRDSVLVAHNASFDLSYLNLAAQRLSGQPLTDVALCTLKLARRLIPEVRRRGLDALAEHFGLEVGRRHRAMGDVEITVEIFWRLIERAEHKGLRRLGELIALQDQARDGRPFFSPLPRAQVEALPEVPGIYRFYDAADRLLYIGRARNLRRRVASYLSNASGHSPKTLDLIRHVHRVHAEPAANELEAALAEASAIRAEKPPYNKLGKHLPQLAYIRLGNEKPFPRLSIVRRPRGKRARFLGPFRDRSEAERFLKVLLRTFGLRTCAGKLHPDPEASPCLQGQLRLCTMPCTGAITAEAYASRISAFVEDLERSWVRLRQDLEQRRDDCARGERFEVAQRLQDDLSLLDRLTARFSSLGWLTAEQNFLLLLPCLGSADMLAYWIREGRLVSRMRIATLSQFDEWLREVLSLQVNEGRPDWDASAVIAGWLRDGRTASGYLFRFPASEKNRPATLWEEWRAACAALLQRPVVSAI